VAEKECIWCDRSMALLGLIAGIGIAYLAVDLLTDGMLTKSLTRVSPKLAAVIDLPAVDGESGAGEA
jgi:hypothetical protein